MRKTALVAAAVLAGLLLAACGSSAPAGLTGKTWQLTAISEKVPAFQGVIPAADQSRYTITFNTDGTFAANADCNVVGGTYKTSGADGISITPGVSTLAICPDGSFADLFVHGLGRADTYAAAGDVLTLSDKLGATMSFTAAPAESASPAASAEAVASATATPTAKPTDKPTEKPTAKPTAAPTPKPTAGATPAPATGLVGPTWKLNEVKENAPAFQGQVPADQQSNYTVTFKADGTLSATADCNDLTGTYTVADNAAASGSMTITIDDGTRVACPDGSLGDLYTLGLSNAASYGIASGALTITLKDDGSLIFR